MQHEIYFVRGELCTNSFAQPCTLIFLIWPKYAWCSRSLREVFFMAETERKAFPRNLGRSESVRQSTLTPWCRRSSTATYINVGQVFLPAAVCRAASTEGKVVFSVLLFSSFFHPVRARQQSVTRIRRSTSGPSFLPSFSEERSLPIPSD